MAVRAFIKNMTATNREIADVGITVLVNTLYDLRSRSVQLLEESSDLPAALLAGEVRLVALDQITEYAYDTAIAILSGADPDNPLTWGAHVIHPQDFRIRFTPAEQVAIVAAARTDDDVKNFYDHLHMAGHVDLTSTSTEAGVDLMIAKNLVAAERKATLLAY